MRVVLPSPLFSYTSGQKEVEGVGSSVEELLDHLESRFPGMRHRIIDEQGRIRRHIRFFVNGEGVTDLHRPLRAEHEVLIVAALSGG